ncbi:restriction endonuclease subunit S [Pasteurella multocida]
MKLENIGEIIGGGTPKTNEIDNWNGHIPWVTPADMKYISGKYIKKGTRNITSKGLHSSSARILTKNSIIYSSRAPIGYIAITLNELATNQGFKSIDLYKKEVVDYIYYALIYFTPDIQARASGTTFKEISGSEFGKTITPLPPLAEQKRIVAKIEALLPFVEQYTKKEQELTALHQSFPSQLKKSILQAAIQGKLVEQNPQDEPVMTLIARIRAEKERLISEKKLKKPKQQKQIFRRDNSHYELIDGVERCIDGELPFEIPDSWCWVRLRDIAIIFGGFAFKSNYFTNIGNLVIRISDFNNNGLILKSNMRYEYTPNLKKYLIYNSDIIMAMTGGTVGKSLYISELPEDKVLINQRVACIRSILVNSKYTNLVINSSFTLNKINRIKNSTNDNISIEDINDFYMPIPPLDEQERIVEKIEELFSHFQKLEKN